MCVVQNAVREVIVRKLRVQPGKLFAIWDSRALDEHLRERLNEGNVSLRYCIGMNVESQVSGGAGKQRGSTDTEGLTGTEFQYR